MGKFAYWTVMAGIAGLLASTAACSHEPAAVYQPASDSQSCNHTNESVATVIAKTDRTGKISSIVIDSTLAEIVPWGATQNGGSTLITTMAPPGRHEFPINGAVVNSGNTTVKAWLGYADKPICRITITLTPARVG